MALPTLQSLATTMMKHAKQRDDNEVKNSRRHIGFRGHRVHYSSVSRLLFGLVRYNIVSDSFIDFATSCVAPSLCISVCGYGS